MLVILIKSDREIAIAASSKRVHFWSRVQRRKKYKPIIERLSDGASGMNERPVKIFNGVKLKKNVAQTAAALPKVSRTIKKKNGSETAKRITAWLRPIHSWTPANL
jgi:hypothetical protein